jgi:hypothetical protein
MDDAQPYISLVVTARNDNHGGSLLSRMQAFVNGWIGQCKRHGLSSELIVVDWNPPEDRPPLIKALQWPEDARPCDVRFIQVPLEIHSRFRHADALPLYQMIAKNVGIRRAHGQFVLATNIDIIFSDELMRHLAEGRLEPDRMYRIDRHDVMSGVPVHGTVEEQLAYCESHLIRVNAREGTFNLSADGRRELSDEDIASRDSGISFGRGWFGIERHGGRVFRWVDNGAEITVNCSTVPPSPLLLEIEPGPGVHNEPFFLRVMDSNGTILSRTRINGHSQVRLNLPRQGPSIRTLRLYASGGGNAIPQDPRILNFRVFRCAWTTEARSAMPTSDQTASHQPLKVDDFNCEHSPAGQVRDFVPLFERLLRLLSQVGFLGLLRLILRRRTPAGRLAAKSRSAGDIVESGSGISLGVGWYGVERFAGETFRWVRNNAEIIVFSTEAGPRNMGMLIEPGPGVDSKPFELTVLDQSHCRVASALVNELEYVEIPLACRRGRTEVFVLHIDGGDRPAVNDPRLLNFRLFWCGWSQQSGPKSTPVRLDLPLEPGLMLGGGWLPTGSGAVGETRILGADGAEIVVQAPEATPRVLRFEIEPQGRLPMAIEVRDSQSRILASRAIRGRQLCYLSLPLGAGLTQVFSLHSGESNFYLYRMGWSESACDITEFSSGLKIGSGWSEIRFEDGEIHRMIEGEAELNVTMPAGAPRKLRLHVCGDNSGPVLCRVSNSADDVLQEIAIDETTFLDVELPWSPGTGEALRISGPGLRVYGCQWTATAGEADRVSARLKCEGTLAPPDDDIVSVESGIRLGSGWHSAETDENEVFRWVGNRAEILLPNDGATTALVMDIEAGPSLGSQSFALRITDEIGYPIFDVPVVGRQSLELILPQQRHGRNIYRLSVRGGGLLTVDDPRIRNFRVSRIDWCHIDETHELSSSMQAAAIRVHPHDSRPSPVYLHTNACGDFTLMAREHWFELRGYPEFDMFSFNIDSLLCYTAHHGGAREEVLEEPMRIYHIEHGLGSGWTPEGQKQLFDRLNANGISWLEYHDVVAWAGQMRRFQSPIIFNRSNWGLSQFDLPEITLQHKSGSIER